MRAASYTEAKPELSWDRTPKKEKILKRKFSEKEMQEMDARNAWSEVWEGDREVIEEAWGGEEEVTENMEARNIFGLDNPDTYNDNQVVDKL